MLPCGYIVKSPKGVQLIMKRKRGENLRKLDKILTRFFNLSEAKYGHGQLYIILPIPMRKLRNQKLSSAPLHLQS